MEANTWHGNGLDFLERQPPGPLPPLVVMSGAERFLQLHILRHLIPQGMSDQLSRFSDVTVPWRQVADELATRSLFGAGPRYVLIQDADDFVSENRRALEEYVDRPRGQGVLILQVSSFPANTNLYKGVAKSGWIIECRLPEMEQSKFKEVDHRRLQRWLENWARETHRIKLTKTAIQRLQDLVGWELGVLDQELAKLALFVQPGEAVEVALVDRIVGGWRAETNWAMLDAVADGDAARGLLQLDHLLQSGEAPIGLFGSVAWSLRRFAVATRMFEAAQRAGERPVLGACLKQAGFRAWPDPQGLARAEQQLKQLARPRCQALFRSLLRLDLALKGSHSAPSAARYAMEEFILGLAKESRPATSTPTKPAANSVR